MSLAVPVVVFTHAGQEVGRFWPINYRHGESLVAWFNSRKKAEKVDTASLLASAHPTAKMSQAARYPHPWKAWSDNCAAEHLCLRFRGIGWAKAMAYTRPDEDDYLPPPTQDDSSLSLMG